MKRQLLFVLLALFAAITVGAVMLLSGGGAGGGRASAEGGGRTDGFSPAGGGRGGNSGPAAALTAEEQRRKELLANWKGIGSTVPPGLREPFDDAQFAEARARDSTKVEQLFRDLTDPRFNPSEKHAKGLELQQLLRQMGHRVTPEVRGRLLEMLANGADQTIKMQIGSLIGQLDGDTEMASALVQMLGNKADDADARRAIYSALSMMNVHEVTPKLMSMLGEGLADDEPYIIRTVGKLATPEQLAQLYARLDKPLLSTSRVEIEQVLRERGGFPGFFDKVAGDLTTEDPVKKRSLLRILSASREPAHAAKVRELLKEESDGQSRALAIQALGRFGDEESGKVLLDLVQRGSKDDKIGATQAIFTIHNRETIGMFASPQVFGDLTEEGKIAVMGAVSRITAPTEAMMDLADRGLQESNIQISAAAARTLGMRGRDAGVDALASFLDRNTHPAGFSAGFAALETIHTRKAAEAALRCIRGVPSEAERRRLEEVFNKILDETAERESR